MKKGFFAILIFLPLLGCGGAPAVRIVDFWKKGGVTYEDARTVHAECKFKVGMEKFESIAEKNEIIDSCMEMQGFRWGQYQFQP